MVEYDDRNERVETEKITIKESVSLISSALKFWSTYHKQLTVAIALGAAFLGYNGDSIVSKIDSITTSLTSGLTPGSTELSDRVSILEKDTKENTILIKSILEEVKKK